MAKNRPTSSGFAPAAPALWLALIAMASVVGFTFAADDTPGIAFSKDLSAAATAARGNKAVTVVLFTMPGCSWCRKMAVTTLADRNVQALAGRFVWVKVNVLDHPDVAARYGVSGVPHIVLLNLQGQVLASRSGYIPPAQMVDILRKYRDKADTPAGGAAAIGQIVEQLKTRVAATQPGQASPALTAAVAHLARPDRQGRYRLRGAVRRCGPAVWPGLCALMADKHLAVRAAAAEALAHATGASLAFDPFADPATRTRQIAAWKKWIRANKGRPTSRPTTAPRPNPLLVRLVGR
ncbi:hypothetical protein LCGC14_2410280 [marine sediment metagenome]|uniref:Thioredoxin domain-containing protein n=1 Tax=marine sediment metagenome TaxID=412755 RepID=A0A0F9CEU7_9ZZZZ